MGKTRPYEIPKQTVWEAYLMVKRNKGSAGIDGKSLEEFDLKYKDNLYKLWNRMSSGSYFPKPVKLVKIPKKNGGFRPLGIPTVEDRIAQMTARILLEPQLETIFHADSYGYRPGKSAHQALTKTKKRCFRFNWVIDLDVKGFFDSIDHELMLKAIDFHKPPSWIRLYIKRWLSVCAVDEKGNEIVRDRGTPQGGVISPLLANLYLHYAFDEWMKRNNNDVLFERYADDIVIHCRNRYEAERLLGTITNRLAECRLTVHPDKTKIVYCKDDRRKASYSNTEFDFLGFTFKKRWVKNRKGDFFMSFTPAISRSSESSIRDEIRSWRIHRRSNVDIFYWAKVLNSKFRGWINYYGRFRLDALYGIHKMFTRILIKWAKVKYKSLKSSWRKARLFITRIADAYPDLFSFWKLGWRL